MFNVVETVINVYYINASYAHELTTKLTLIYFIQTLIK